jgi:hypothetical protein
MHLRLYYESIEGVILKEILKIEHKLFVMDKKNYGALL